MFVIRKAEDRGTANFDWLNSKHTFSFGHYYDPAHMGVGPLRVINEDRVKPGAGFDTHGHRDMEIISYVLQGALEHKDSIGTGSVIRPGEVQRMSAGTGIRHSEFNHSKNDPVHFLQIWIQPERDQIEPSYEQKAFSDAEKRGRLRLVGSRDGRDGSVTIHQDVDLYAGLFDAGETTRHSLQPGRGAWVQVARGELDVNGEWLKAGDGAAIADVDAIEIKGRENGEVLVFDMAA
ncbi:MAG: pirin family protein [Alphaproteobacteria bacterium]|nr:pirin family protein [Alphaproteobacteria bacterium]